MSPKRRAETDLTHISPGEPALPSPRPRMHAGEPQSEVDQAKMNSATMRLSAKPEPPVQSRQTTCRARWPSPILTILLLTLAASASGCATAVPPGLLTPAPDEGEPLQAGDMLRIEVWQHPEFSGEFEIGVGGGLVHPLYQELRLIGLDPPDARGALENFLVDYLQGARVTVEPLYKVSVGGEVRSPNVYHVSRSTTIAEAIAVAGGPTARAKLDEVRLVRGAQVVPLSLGDDLTTFAGIQIVSGDQIFVEQESDFNVWRSVVGPVSTLAALILTSIRIGERAR